MPRDVSVKITANTSGFDSSVQGMAAKVQRSAAEIKSAADKALGSVDSLAKGNTRLARAQAVAADAAEAVALAEARLEAVRKRAKSSVTANIAAENQLASAQRKSVLAQRELATVQNTQGKSKFFAAVKENEGNLNKLGGAMLKVGAVGAIGLGLSAKAAIDWDSAWAGVTKTVSGTPKQLALVESGLRGLARTMPETATQIAAVAENAGQLGIATPDILTFTKTMVQLGDTTNLTSEEASTSFGQLLNVMGDAPQTVGALGDVLVKLGNNGASTEKNILELGTRLSGAGKQIGLTTPQVLAFGSAISSTGIEAEAGGTAMSQNFFAIDKAVRQGGKSLDLYAQTAGMSSAQFRKAWGDDPASATQQFVAGLGRVQASGGSVRGVLDELGIKSVRQADVYARLAGATKEAGNAADLLASSLKDAGNAQGALGAEAAIRYATSASKIKIALNKIHDDAITTGGALLPAISGITGGIGKVADKFASLDSSTQKGMAGVAVAATGIALVGGAAIKMTTSVASAATALSNLGPAGARAAGVMGGVAKGIGIAAIALAGFEAAEAGVAAVQANSKWDSHLKTSLGDAGQAITAAGKSAADAVPALDSFFQVTTTTDLNPFTGKINGLGDAFKALSPQGGDKIFSALTHGIHLLGGQAGSLDITKQRFEQLDTTLTQVGTTNGPAAAKAFAQIRAQSDLSGHSLDDLVNKQFPQYKKSLEDQATALGVTVPDSAATYADWMGGKIPKAITDAAKANPQLAASVGVATAAIDAQKASLQQLAAQATATSDALVAASNSEIAVQQALGAARQSAKTNGRTTNIKTAKGQANQSALNNVIASQHQNVQTEAALPHPDFAAIVKGNESVKKSYIDTAKQMGVSGSKAKADAEKNFKLPKQITSQVVVKTDKLSNGEVSKLNKELKGVPPETRAKIVTIAETKGAKAAENALAQIKDKTVIAKADGEAGGAKNVDKVMKSLKDRLVHAKARGDAKGARDVQNAMDRLKDRQVIARSKGETGGARSVDKAMRALKDRLVKAQARGDASGARAVQSAMNALHDKTVTARIITRRETIVTKKTNDVTGPYTGGLITPAGVLYRSTSVHRSNGGPVWGAGTATSDSIPAMLSNGEFVINAKSVQAIGVNRLAYANQHGELPKFAAGGFASGGKAKKPSGPAPIFTTDREVLAAVTAQFHVDQAKNLAERRKADVELAKAMKKLNDTQSAALDSIKSLSTSLQEPYRSKSTDVDDVLASLKDGAKDISAFGSQVSKLKAMGLQQGVIDQITADGAVNGGELAGQILAGGQGLVDALNKANDDLTKAGTALGKTSVGLVQDAPAGKPKTPKKKALGGYLTGPGSGTSDSIPLLASNGEYIVNAASTAANRSVLDAINYGRASINEHRFMPGYAGGGYVAPQPASTSYHAGDTRIEYVGDPEQAMRREQTRKRDNMTMARLTGTL